jgi:hemerythrin
MIIQWDEGLAVHNPVLDDQHREFIRLVNNLDDITLGRGDMTVKVIEAVEFLESYAKTHFAFEESYFIEHDFPEAREHQELHDGFIQTIHSMRKELDMTGVTAKLANDISRFVGDWLLMHVRAVDHRYVVFIDTGVLPPKQQHKHFVNKWQK